MAKGLLDYDLLPCKPAIRLGPDSRELFEQLIVLECRLEKERAFLRMLPGRRSNPELVEGSERFSALSRERLMVLGELAAAVPLRCGRHAAARVCWEINTCTMVAANRY